MIHRYAFTGISATLLWRSIKHGVARAFGLRRSLSGVEMPVVLLLCLVLSSCGLVPNTSQQTGNRPATAQNTLAVSAVASVQPAGFKTTNGPTTPLWPPPQEIQTFQSWVPDQTLTSVTKLPGGQHFKLKLVVAKAPPPPGLDAKQAKELADLEDDQNDGSATLTNEGEDDKEDVEPGDDEDLATAKKPYNRRDRVFIPEHGAFTLTFQAGSAYQVLDGDARDGSAVVQMPREVLEGYLKVRGKHSREVHGVFPAVTRKISYADPLYYVKQDLSREKKQHQKQTWLRIGNRVLPIPTDWRSVDGDKYVLKLNNQGVTRLVMRWYKGKGNQVAQADFPPGLNSIGPSGGEVNLPGVARLVFPAGSLSQPTTVKISQVLQVPSRHVLCDNPGWAEDCHYGYEFASAVVKLEPLGMVLSQPAKMYFHLDMKIAGEAHPASISEFGSSSRLFH